jgi:hypothetical protein
MFTPTRVVCHNTLAMAKKNCTNKITIRHTASAKDKLNQAAELMNITHNAIAYTGELFNQMAKTRISDDKVKELIDRLFLSDKELVELNLDDKLRSDVVSTRKSNIITEVTEYTFGHETQQLDTTKGTLWGFYNGITGYYQNAKDYKTPDSKFKSNLLGSNYTTMGKALELATDLL